MMYGRSSIFAKKIYLFANLAEQEQGQRTRAAALGVGGAGRNRVRGGEKSIGGALEDWRLAKTAGGRSLGPPSVCGRTNGRRTTMASSDESYNQEYLRLRRLESGFNVRKISVSLRANPTHLSRAGKSGAKAVALDGARVFRDSGQVKRREVRLRIIRDDKLAPMTLSHVWVWTWCRTGAALARGLSIVRCCDQK